MHVITVSCFCECFFIIHKKIIPYFLTSLKPCSVFHPSGCTFTCRYKQHSSSYHPNSLVIVSALQFSPSGNEPSEVQSSELHMLIKEPYERGLKIGRDSAQSKRPSLYLMLTMITLRGKKRDGLRDEWPSFAAVIEAPF